MTLSGVLKLGMLGSFAAAAPMLAVAEPSPDPSAWTQWGVLGFLVIFLMYKDREREQRLATSEQACTVYVRETMHKAIERNTAAFERLSERLQMKGE